MVMIEKLDVLKAWLVKKLTPMCDADPSALAKYVVALIKKDKTDDELRKLCVDQLEVFLLTETERFVAGLFETLKTKSYMDEPVDMPQQQGSEATNLSKSEEPKKEPRRRIQRPSPIRHRSRSPYDRRRRREGRRSRSPLRDRRRDRRYRSHSGSPKKSRLSPKRKSPPRRSRSRSRSPYRRRRRTRSLSSSRSSSRSPDSSHQKQISSSTDDRLTKKKRCWDYDKKGFCILGDSCPYDHGKDPVVVEDSAISSSTNRTVTAPPMPPVTGPPPVLPPITKVIPPPMLPHPFLPPPPLGLPPPPGMRPPNMRPPIPPPLPPNVRVPPPRILPPPPSGPPPPGYNPEAPGLNYDLRRQNQTNLVSISADGPPGTTDGGFLNRNRVVQLEGEGEGDAPNLKRTIYNATVEGGAQPGVPNTNNYSNNTKLVIRKIPPPLNNITKLNEHFSRFGAINNIQVKFENDPQCALVEFAHATSARAAKRDTGAIFNNRFIVVYWYNPQQQNNGRLNKPQGRLSVKDRLGTLPTPSQLKYTAPGKETKPTNQKEATAAGGTIFRTIPNPAATPAPAQKPAEATVDNAETKAKVQQAQKAAKEKLLARQKLVLQKRMELQKGKKELLQKQMEQQKAFLNKIKSTKDMPPAEKLKLLESLKALTASIDKLRTSLKGEEASNPLEAKEKQKQTQKELLDAELDLYNASTTGENTVSLKRKLSQLKMEASSLGLVTAYRGGYGNYRGRGRGGSYVPRAKQPRVFSSSANLDRRPRELRITGFHEDEKDELISHLARFGEIENFEFRDDDITCVVKFQTRPQAEVAAASGPVFKNRRLIIVWNTPIPTPTAPEPQPVPEVQESPELVQEPEEPSPEALVVPEVGEAEEEGSEGVADDDDDVNVHIGDVTVNYPGETGLDVTEEFGDIEEELDEDALLAADYDEDDDHIGDDEYDEEIRSWRR